MPEFASNETDRKLLVALSSPTEIGRALAGEPRIPMDRATALRMAFMAMVGVADAKKRQMDVEPLDGSALQKVVADVVAMPKPLVDRLKAASKKKLTKKK